MDESVGSDASLAVPTEPPPTEKAPEAASNGSILSTSEAQTELDKIASELSLLGASSPNHSPARTTGFPITNPRKSYGDQEYRARHLDRPHSSDIGSHVSFASPLTRSRKLTTFYAGPSPETEGLLTGLGKGEMKLVRIESSSTSDSPSAEHKGEGGGGEPSVTSSDRMEPVPCKDSREAYESLMALLSALYSLLVIILALSFDVSTALSQSQGGHEGSPGERKHDSFEVFYIYLYSLGLLFLSYAQCFLLSNKIWNAPSFPSRFSLANLVSRPSQGRELNVVRSGGFVGEAGGRSRVTHAAPSAGSFYLRLGCIAFGLVGLIYFALDSFSEIVLLSCNGTDCRPVQSQKNEITRLVSDILAATYIFAQMYFIFQNAKLTIHRFRILGRFGLMHLVATNLCMWLRYIVIEEIHTAESVYSVAHQDEVLHQSNGVHDDDRHRRAAANIPTSTAGSLYSSTANSSASLKCSRRFSMDCHMSPYVPFFTTCIIEYSIIAAAVMFCLWFNVSKVSNGMSRNASKNSLSTPDVLRQNSKRKERFNVDCSSSSKGLFLGLLLVVCTLIGMVIFFVNTATQQNETALMILFGSDGFLYLISVVAGLYGMWKMRDLHFLTSKEAHAVLLIDDILLFIGTVGQLLFCILSVVGAKDSSESMKEEGAGSSNLFILFLTVTILRMIQVMLQTVFILTGQRLIAGTGETMRRKPGRQTVTFLLMVNLALFLINTFETQKAAVNPLTLHFYGVETWTVLVHATVPLTIFHRFHSSVCLAEIWKNTYREKQS